MIAAVADKLEVVNPEIVPLNVNVPEVVIVPPPNVIPDTVPDADTDVTVPDPPGDVVIMFPEESNANNPATVPENDDGLV